MLTYPSVFRVFALLVLALAASGCQAIMTIFEAGMWVGVIMVVVALGIVAFIATKLRRP